MKTEAFRTALTALGVADPPRVWSFIITVFGDLAQTHGDVISGPVLADILSPVGVRPEAMRVALHRLRNEGWIETAKLGRVGLHSLSPFGLQQSVDAREKIYAPVNLADPEWHILCYAPVPSLTEQARASTLRPLGYIAISTGVYLCNRPASDTPSDGLVLQGSLGDVPDWLSRSLASSQLRSGFDTLAKDLARLALEADKIEEFTALQIATLRAQIVHRWRKLVLKLPDVPDVLFGPNFEGARCRDEVNRALGLLQRPTIASLA